MIQKKIKPFDALHLSCAINAKADEPASKLKF
jgi:hypothetical protein